MIQAIAITTGLLGCLLMLILLSRIKSVDNQAKLNKHRSTSAGFADLLNYAAMVDDGVIVGKNGSFMAAFLYKGDDNASSTDDQRELVSLRINQAFSGLGNGWMIHVDATRRDAPKYPDPSESHFPDPISRLVDEERRELFGKIGTMYEGYFVVTITWFPPALLQSKFVELMFDDDEPPPNHKQRTYGLIEQFKREIVSIESRLSSAIQLTRLKSHTIVREDGSTITNDDFLAWLNYCITGRSHPMVLPSNPMYLDNILASQEFWGGVVPKIGNKFIQVVAIEGFPLESSPGLLTMLSELPCEYRWSSRFIFIDQHEALKMLEKFRKKWKQKVRGFFDQVFNTAGGKVDHDALSMVQDADSAVAEVSSGLVAMGYYTSVVVLMDEDRSRLGESARKVEKAVNRLGFAARIETINTIDAYLGSLPGHGVENVRRPLINTLNLADLLPTSSIWTGDEHCPCPLYPANSPALLQAVTNGATPFRLNLHIRDLGHSIMLGPTRAGKSTHLGLIALQALRYEGMTVFAFDKGMSMYPVTKAVNGVHFSVASDESDLAFCPLQFLETKGDRAWAMDWIDTLLALNGVNTTAEQRNEIANAVLSMHQSGAKTLSELTTTIQDNVMREALKQYTVDGSMGHLLDAEHDGLSFSDTNFFTFEIEELMNLGEKYALPVLLYLFRRIEKRLQGQPALIPLDEAWIMLGHPVFKEKIRDWLKAFAKKNCSLLMSTQSLSDAVNSGIFDVITESTATKIFLPNPNAREDQTASLYRQMGLNPKQIEIISSAVKKRQYYCVSEAGRRLYELALGPVALAFVGATDLDSIAEIKTLEKTSKDWRADWLESRGINTNKYLELKNEFASQNI